MGTCSVLVPSCRRWRRYHASFLSQLGLLDSPLYQTPRLSPLPEFSADNWSHALLMGRSPGARPGTETGIGL